jgi:integrase
MAINKLTDATFRKTKPSASEQLLSDGGGLYMRVRPAEEGGAISFRLVYRIGGKQRWLTLGGYPVMSLAEARRKRDEYKSLIKSGVDPSLERQIEIRRNRQAQLDEKARLEREASRATVKILFERWTALELAKRKESSRKELIRAFEKDVIPLLGHLFADEVTKAHVMLVLDAILTRGANRLANRTLSEMRQMFGFAYTRDIIQTDPTHRIKKIDVGGKETERDRVLSEVEITELSLKITSANLHLPTECAIWIMLSTGCRVGDLMKATWSEIDLSGRVWTFSPEKDKTHIKRIHKIYLSDFTLGWLEILKKESGETQWLYPDKTNTKAVCKKSITRQIGDRQRAVAFKNRTQELNGLSLSGGHWTPHDLRRTATTLMVDLGVSPDVAHRCTYHIEPDRIKRIYNRSQQRDEQLDAWKRLGERLGILTGHLGSNVRTLPVVKRKV